ncbi:hypothetical protein E4T56_gene14635 [Termitomyces sp. T112]|nr:hypothetical protein E4T56_gene14635 [Termitomyces sp. T112]
MNQRLPTAPGTLRIWQQNVRKSSAAQADILAVACPEEWDVLAIQEPYLDFLGNTRASSYWRVLYPSDHRKDGSTRSRSVLLINTNISTDAFTQLTSTPQISQPFASQANSVSSRCLMSTTTANTMRFLLPSLLSSPHWHTLPAPPLDFIQPLLDMLTAYDMELALPPGIPTLQTASDRWTRPDNIWRSHTDVDPIISCDVVPSLCPTRADHLPIVTEVELPVQRTSSPPSKDFHSVDWTAFNEALTECLSTCSPALPILTEEAFDTKVRDLTLIIQEIMNIDDIVPIRKPCPHTKRWWNGSLKQLKAQRRRADNLAYRFRDIPDHQRKLRQHGSLTKWLMPSNLRRSPTGKSGLRTSMRGRFTLPTNMWSATLPTSHVTGCPA